MVSVVPFFYFVYYCIGTVIVIYLYSTGILLLIVLAVFTLYYPLIAASSFLIQFPKCKNNKFVKLRIVFVFIGFVNDLFKFDNLALALYRFGS